VCFTQGFQENATNLFPCLLGQDQTLLIALLLLATSRPKKINNLKMVGSSTDGHHAPHALVTENGAMSSFP
jgi:hypothetical protein